MTFSTRPLARVSIACAATALALSACSGKGSTEDPTTPTPSVSASATASVEATPAPGEWTLEDLKVGTKVPKEDLERLFPKWEVPEPPATLTEFSEQGATDAAIYYDRLIDVAFYNRAPDLLNRVETNDCINCNDLRKLVSEDPGENNLSTQTSLRDTEIKRHPTNEKVYEVQIRLRAEAIALIDNTSHNIKNVARGVEELNYAYVAFINGQWVAGYLKSSESQL